MPMGDLAAQDDYTTPLAADDIPDFQKWKQQYAPRDSGYDYDLPGAYKAGLTPDVATGHWDDQFKKPNHPTFSTFSQYAKDRPDLAGTWQGDQYIPPPARLNLSPDETLMQPPRSALDLPPEAYASLGGGDLGLLGSKGIAGLFNRPSWLQKAQDLTQKDVTNYQTGGVPAMMGDLAADSSDAQDLAGGFGGNIKGVKPPLVPGALAAMGEYHPPFYSAVERAVQDAKQNTAPGQQWAGFLRNQPGVKPEEVETLGLGKLFEQPTVPKQAVLDQIAANKVNVGEVVKSEQSQRVPATRVNEIDQQLNDIQNEFDSLHGVGGMDERRAALAAHERDLRNERQDVVANWQDQASGRTKFSQYTLPGGENYREMLLTLPKETRVPSPDEIENLAKTRYEGYHMKENDPPWERLAPDVQRLYREQANDKIITAESPPAFRSSHYDEPNILAHVRYNDRVIDGKKTLFVEEVQSDWHQKGKREGYQSGSTLTPDESGELRSLQQRYDAQRGENFSEADLSRMNTLQSKLEQNPQGVPDAPFKTTWPDLAMKRIIREAAEKGYDKVAWTPGSVQAARYPEQLRQHVNNISWSSPGTPRSNPEGLRYVHATPRAGGMDLVFTVNKDGHITEASANQAKGQHVEDIFGKDMARQIMEKGEGEIASKDFVIGAKGMEGFYDQILPAAVNKLVKKHGARVEPVNLSPAPSEQLTLSGNGPWVARDARGDFVQDFNNRERAEAFVNQQNQKPRQTAHSIDITPSLRAAAMKGFPLFTAGGIVAGGAMGDLAKQDDYQ